MKKIVTLVVGLIPVGLLRKVLLNILGHKISYNSKFGINILWVKHISLEEDSSIGHFNFIANKLVRLEKKAFIKNFNYFRGPFDVYIGNESGISNNNKFRRAKYPISVGDSSLQLGKNSFIVSGHFVDLTRAVSFGDNSILAGIRSQIWTHGYYHANDGSDRVRIDGDVVIGNNVYIGSSCIFNPGIKVLDAIHIGAGSVISKNLEESGMYVGQGLRFVSKNIDDIKSKLHKVEDENLVEDVYYK
ncbi:hypothetical protein BWZ20_09310 [Winogradskyella sp. J14-2]|uniref:acyltransferase n=1 Tax=Winogradskyella sp. J14-2 TaxID=1936080 RepID=UPI000972A51D|nr:hypothetical protein [Winogradskyella sp. J14-2]APY08484.1 hypothetical protein BWZ20_09310 [Winogradskyella sp. J14-2]